MNLLFAVLMGVLPSLVLAQAPVERAPLVMTRGEQRLLRFDSVSRFSVGNPAVARAVAPPRGLPGGEGLLVKAVEEGSSDLWVWKSDGSVEHRPIAVERTSPSRLPPGLARGLSELEECEVLLSGTTAVLRGTIDSPREAARIAALVREYRETVRNETEPSESLLGPAHRRLTDWIQSSGLAEKVRVERHGSTLWLRGSLSQPKERVWVESQAGRIHPLVELDVDSLPDNAPTVHFRVYLLEVRKTGFSSLGIGWPAFQEGAFRVSSWGIKEALALDLTLQALEGKGLARVLSKPELVVRAPGEAELFAGGELPIRTESRYRSDVSWKSFGLQLKLKVTHAAGPRVRLEVQTEVSHLDPTLTADPIPGLQANRMKTQVDATFGVPLLLSGLLQEGTREKARGLPLLRQVPILGALFGSEDYLSERSELVAILLPNASPPPSPKLWRKEDWNEWRHDEPAIPPRGPVPAPRDAIPAERERALRAHPDFPWNAFDGAKGRAR